MIDVNGAEGRRSRMKIALLIDCENAAGRTVQGVLDELAEKGLTNISEVDQELATVSVLTPGIAVRDLPCMSPRATFSITSLSST